MSTPQNPLSTPMPWDTVATGYVESTMEFFQEYAKEAIDLAGVTTQSQVLDVACGPGTLSLLVSNQVNQVQAIDFSEPMVAHFHRHIEEQKIENIELNVGDGQALTFTDNSFDAAFSMFGLIFFPDRHQGFRELYRTLKPGGRAIVSSWAPMDQSPAMKMMFGALQAMNPDMPAPQKSVDSLEDPEVFERDLRNAGFRDIQIHPVTKSFPVESIEELWSGVVRGGAPIAMMKKQMGEKLWAEKEKEAIAYLKKELPTLPTSLSSDAWIGVGVK